MRHSAGRRILSTATITCICSRKFATPCCAPTEDFAPDAWVRQCGQLSARRRLTDHKALLLDGLSRRFRRLAADHGLRTNPAFAGTYTFRSDAA